MKRNFTMYYEVMALSSGTMATLIADTSYEKIDAMQHRFAEWVAEQNHLGTFYQHWQEAWEAFRDANWDAWKETERLPGACGGVE